MNMFLSEARIRPAAAIFLAMIAGYLDGYGFLFLGTYVSFMSGNTTIAGLRSGQDNFLSALPSAIAVFSFVTGSFFGNFFSQSKSRYSHRLIFGLIAGLLATVAGLEWRGSRNAPEIAVLSLAMGMMNPALSKIGAESVSLTFMTGMLSRIGGHLASAARRKPLPDGQGLRDSHLARAGLDASIWSGFFVGAALAGMSHLHFRLWALLLPCVVVIVLGTSSAGNSTQTRSQRSIGFCGRLSPIRSVPNLWLRPKSRVSPPSTPEAEKKETMRFETDRG
jgi:uncharacterized membrane protein YoaK (UPF0700 family)